MDLEDYFDCFSDNKFLSENSMKQLAFLHPLVKNYIGLEKLNTIVDIASGSGIFSEALEDIFPKANYYLIDISKKSLIQSKYLNKVQGDAHFAPVQSNIADLLLCRQGVHYMNLVASFAEFRRLLKHNGYLLISTEWWIDGDESEEEKNWLKKVFYSRNKPASNLMNKSQLLNLLKKFDFEIIFHSLNFEKQKIPVQNWIELYDEETIKYSEIRKSILEFAPLNSLEKGYPCLVNGEVEYMSKWMIVLCRLSER